MMNNHIIIMHTNKSSDSWPSGLGTEIFRQSDSDQSQVQGGQKRTAARDYATK